MGNRPITMDDSRLLVVIHHSASNDTWSDPDALKAERQRRGEGYNFIIDDDLSGPNDKRFEAVQDAPDDEISNGTYGENWRSWNICIDGNFEETKPTEDEIYALVQVLATKCKAWKWRKKDVWRITYHQYVGMHISDEYYVTACPGLYLISRMVEIRKRVAGYLPQ